MYQTALPLRVSGGGYQVKMIQRQGMSFNKDEIMRTIRATATEAELSVERIGELNISLNTLRTKGLETMFATLEQKRSLWGIQAIGVTVSTLEDAFIKYVIRMEARSVVVTFLYFPSESDDQGS